MDTNAFNNSRFRNLLLSFPAKAVELLIREYGPKLTALSVWLTKDQRQAEEIVQDAFMEIWKDYKRLGSGHEKSIERYLTRIVRNNSINFYWERIKANELTHDYLVLNEQDDNRETCEDHIVTGEVNVLVRMLIDTFPRAERECLIMRIYEEMTPEQIADRQKVTLKAVQRSLTCAHKRLRLYGLSRKGQFFYRQ